MHMYYALVFEFKDKKKIYKIIKITFNKLPVHLRHQ